MGDYRDKLAKKATDVLLPEEELLAGARLVRSVLGMATGVAVGGVIGAMIVNRSGADDGPKGLLAGSLELPKQVAVGLTDRRIIFWARSLWTGGATKVLGELELSQVAEITYDQGAWMGKLDIRLVDGSQLHFEAPRMEKGSARRIGDEWQRIAGSRSSKHAA